jgi:hypothetical protein
MCGMSILGRVALALRKDLDLLVLGQQRIDVDLHPAPTVSAFIRSTEGHPHLSPSYLVSTQSSSTPAFM